MIQRLLRRLALVISSALVFVGTTAATASAQPRTWADTPVAGLHLIIVIVLLPLGIAATIALVVWTSLTAKERASTRVVTRSGGQVDSANG